MSLRVSAQVGGGTATRILALPHPQRAAGLLASFSPSLCVSNSRRVKGQGLGATPLSALRAATPPRASAQPRFTFPSLGPFSMYTSSVATTCRQTASCRVLFFVGK